MDSRTDGTCRGSSRLHPRAARGSWLTGVTVGLAGLVGLVAAGACLGQPEPPPRHELASQFELARLVDLAAERLRLNIDYDPGVLKGTATLRLAEAISDDELWILVNRVLASRGFTTIRMPGQDAFTVVKLAEAAALASVRVLEPETAGSGPVAPEPADQEVGREPGFAAVLYRVRARPARELQEPIGKLLSKPGGSVGVLSEGSLIIADLSPRLAEVRRALAQLDTAGDAAIVEEVRLRNLTGTQMAILAGQVAAKRDVIGAGGVAGGPDKASGPLAATAGAGGSGVLEVLAGPDAGSVLIVAPPMRVAAWRELIERLDDRPRTQTVTYTPRNHAPRDVAKLIEQTVRSGGGGGGSGGAAGGGGAGGSGTGGDDRPRVVVDDLTGSLIITGSPAQHEAVAALLARLDDTPASALARRPVRSFTIKNRPVDEVLAIVQQLMQAGALVVDTSGESSSASTAMPPASAAAGSTGSSAPAVIAMPPPPASPPVPARPAPARASGISSGGAGSLRSDNPSVIFTIDPGTNTLIAVGDSRVLEQVDLLIQSLDVRQAQVMLEVLLVTLSRGQTLDLGVELEKLQISGDTLFRLSSLFGLGTRTSGGDRTGPDSASGLTGVVLNPGDFSIVVRALETLTSGRSLSMPRVLVGNNQEASIDSVVQQPFASVNASNTVSTTSFGGTQDAGTVVSIRPQIAEGDHLLLEYSVSLSAFLGAASSPTLPPPRQQNRVASSATIPDGYTVVVGGIEVQTTGKTVSQVPLLGSIPIIGEAFKNRANSESSSKFYVFIRASVLRHRGFEDLKYLSGQGTQAAGVDDGWPKVEPIVIK